MERDMRTPCGAICSILSDAGLASTHSLSGTEEHRCCDPMSSRPVAGPRPPSSPVAVIVAVVMTPVPHAMPMVVRPAMVVPVPTVVVMTPVTMMVVMAVMVMMGMGHRLRCREHGRTDGHDREDRGLDDMGHDTLLSARIGLEGQSRFATGRFTASGGRGDWPGRHGRDKVTYRRAART